MLSKIGGGRHKQLALTMTSDEYAAHMGFAFVPSHNSGNYPPTIGNAQEQAPGTEKFRQNQALFQKYTAIDRSLTKQIITAVEPVFLYPLVDQLTGFGQVSALTMIQNLFLSYGTIGKKTEENSVKIMRPYNPVKHLSQLIEQLENGR